MLSTLRNGGTASQPCPSGEWLASTVHMNALDSTFDRKYPWTFAVPSGWGITVEESSEMLAMSIESFADIAERMRGASVGITDMTEAFMHRTSAHVVGFAHQLRWGSDAARATIAHHSLLQGLRIHEYLQSRPTGRWDGLSQQWLMYPESNFFETYRDHERLAEHLFDTYGPVRRSMADPW